jgi:cellulose synthase/poly-beta-1,6-N-acetylglucosamine synthase-like glycosyltransferase
MLLVELLYFASTVLLALYGFVALLHTWLYWRQSQETVQPEAAKPAPAWEDDQAPPLVTVQLPIYNERHVAERLLRSVLRLAWPAGRLQIQVLDDSTDDTPAIVAATIAAVLPEGGSDGPECRHIRRASRQGYKAGALQHGLATASGEYIAIFDADFVAPPDFLQRILPLFADEQVGCVQTRWGHLNRHSSALTEAQALGIDGHFVVEQATRSRMGAFLNFNGTAGVWRRTCMAQAGGWQGDTLTEDLDLSYRAQLSGWRIHYQGNVVVPAELPLQVEAFKRQQFRWAKGSIQTAIKLLGRLWASRGAPPIPFWKKALGTLHLTNYAVHPLMLANLLLLLPMTFSESILLHVAALFTVAAVGPPSMYWAVQSGQGLSTLQRLRRLGVLMSLGMGLSLNNTCAVVEAVTGVKTEFKRTPKFAATDRGASWQTSIYALPRNPIVWLELALAVYSALLLVYCLSQGIWWVSFWVLLYVAGFVFVAGLGFVQAWQLARAAGTSTPSPEPHAIGGEAFDRAGLMHEPQ